MRKPSAIPPQVVQDYWHLFVNRRAYTLQSARPHPETGRHYYFRPSDKRTGASLELTEDIIRRHLEGEITVGLYAINPDNQCCKWVAIDADYKHAMEDLLKLQYRLGQDGVQPALEMSRRGGHLWIFLETPLLAKECRIYIHDVALRLGVPVKEVGLREGIEVFPKHDVIAPGGFGNALRGPLGIHCGKRGNSRRKMITPLMFRGRTARSEFRILEQVGPVRKVGRNYVTRCPSCAEAGHDRSGDNLAILIEDPRFYRCWAGCSKQAIRLALGCPIRIRESRPALAAQSDFGSREALCRSSENAEYSL